MTKTIFITGATDGLGKALAKELAKDGHDLLLHGRNRDRLQTLISEISTGTRTQRIVPYVADFSSLQEVDDMVNDILNNEQHIDVLVNNAGIGAGTSNQKRSLSKDGYELRFAVNYLAPYLLTRKLLPLLRESAKNQDEIRIVNVASVGQRSISFDDVMLENGYTGINAYSQSKLAMIMFSFDLANELEREGISVNSLHPATLMPTKMTIEAFGYGMATVNEGMIATKRLIASDEMTGITGTYFDGLSKSYPNPQAYDLSARAELRRLSEKLTTLDKTVKL